MKKIFTLALTALALGWTSNVFAQEEEDVTNYISNPGFDEDLTFQADGTWKEAVNKQSLTNRTEAWIAEDETVYGHTKATSTETRADGLKEKAVNGFIGRIKGWEIETNQTFPQCEWVYFGSVPYALEEKAVPIADNGDTYLAVPAKPDEDSGEDNVGAVYLRAGWGGACSYKQTVSLPCAVYRLDYWIYNFNYEGSKNNTKVKNLCKVICRKDVFEDTDGFNAQEWTKHSIEFTPTSEFSIQFGFQSDGGSGSNPYLFIDGIKLYKIGEADRAEILQADLYDLGVALQEFMGEEPFSNYNGLLIEIEEMAGKADEASNLPDDKLDEMERIYNEVDAYRQKLETLKTTLEEYGTAIDDAETFYTDESAKDNPYPGIDQLYTDIENIKKTADEAGSDDFAQLIQDIQTAKNKYYMSQEATKDNPADYTFLIENPTFIQVNPDDNKDVSKSAWYIGQSGGDQRFHTGLTDNDGQSMTAWNAWRNNLDSPTQSVSINQDLTNLPNGFYTVTADMVTQAGCITDQHVFANGTVESAKSPVMTKTGWDPYEWETLTTEKVLVTDGKLTIGAIGHGSADTPDMHGGTDTDHRCGWFCISNFKLSYYGTATPEEEEAAKNQKYIDAQALVDALHLAGDKANLTDSIADAKAENDLDKVNRAIAIAEASEAEYNGIITGSYKDLNDIIASEKYSNDVKALAHVPAQYMTDYLGSATATYEKTGAITAVLRAYRDNLIPTVVDAEKKQNELTSDEGKAFIADAISYVKGKLSAYTEDTKVIDDQVKVLKDAIAAADLYNVEVEEGADLTAYIKNPTVDDTNATGWTFLKIVGDGNGAKNGQQYDGNGSGYYMDTWQPTAGTTRATWYQVLNVPNGTYTLSNIMRTSGAGAYLFASDKAPVKNEEEVETLDATANNLLSEAVVKPTDYKYFYETQTDPETGEVIGRITEAKNATDSYGEVWCTVADKLMALAGVTEATEASTIFSQVADVLQGSPEVAPEGVDELDWKIFAANGGIGRGWFNNSIEGIVVTDHTLVIGISCDYAFLNKTEEEKFQGTWFSADNFKLTLTTEGDNAGWNPTTGIANVEAPAAKTSNAIFNIAGQQVDKSFKGIVIKNGKKYLQK